MFIDGVEDAEAIEAGQFGRYAAAHGREPFVVIEPVRMTDAAAATATSATSPQTLAVDVRHVSLTFETADGQVNALSNVSLQIAEGEFVSFIGPSGCGKTTLLRVIADLRAADGGRFSVNGVSAEQARLERAYGYVFQAPALYSRGAPSSAT